MSSILIKNATIVTYSNLGSEQKQEMPDQVGHDKRKKRR